MGGDKPRPYGKCQKSYVGEGFMPSRKTLNIRKIVYLVGRVSYPAIDVCHLSGMESRPTEN